MRQRSAGAHAGSSWISDYSCKLAEAPTHPFGQFLPFTYCSELSFEWLLYFACRTTRCRENTECRSGG